ncbi:hypothetical protein EGR_06968 [Echinococcus granulosus]|uniref:Uncharacterized protein n=1 Tax=Echinococcus granulosus TaxID=6210 RepID=W6UXF1_ECHGR|nr:hypothetical protein EGR_06968 [Echinococcus granulosus]EUB58224.1 hypothetical protein EGR_06968 [Echinococcus granulosus]
MFIEMAWNFSISGAFHLHCTATRQSANTGDLHGATCRSVRQRGRLSIPRPASHSAPYIDANVCSTPFAALSSYAFTKKEKVCSKASAMNSPKLSIRLRRKWMHRTSKKKKKKKKKEHIVFLENAKTEHEMEMAFCRNRTENVY